MTTGYAITLALAIGLLIAYLLMVKDKEFWMTLLYICVTVVNLGYLMLSMSTMVEFAVLSNDVVYLGSVFLSACMFLTIVRLCGFKVRRVHVITCVTFGVLMFAIIASSPMLPLYYESVAIETVGGATKLVKDYGILHPVYLVYLLGYFVAMIITIICSVKMKKIGKPKFAGFIAGIVCSNIVLWLFEKFINWEFEFLAVMYIASELMLLLVYWMMQDYVYKEDVPEVAPATEEQSYVDIATMPMDVKISRVLSSLESGEVLSTREREILEFILDNKKRREIAEEMHLSENTVKTYTRTLYAKLGVSSRNELYAMLTQK